MSTLTIRNFSDRAHEALRRRAAASGRSTEAEARLLIESLAAPEMTVSQREAIRALRAHAIAAAGGPEKVRGIVDEFLAERTEVRVESGRQRADAPRSPGSCQAEPD